MKHFITLFTFLFLTILVNAQLNMEEISFVPSPSGTYDNLVVKGNVFINNLETSTFDIQSYSSSFTLNVPSKRIYINRLTVPNGTVALSVTNDIGNTNPSWSIVAPNDTGVLATPLEIAMNGGNLSISSISSSNPAKFRLNALNFTGSNPTLDVQAIQSSITDNVHVSNLYIMGMRVPDCSGGYAWQTIQVGSDSDATNYTVLACNNS